MDEIETEVQEIKPKKKTKKKKEAVDSIYLKDYIGSGIGLGEASVKKLELMGVTTVFDVLIRGSNEIQSITEIPESAIVKLTKTAQEAVVKSGRTRNHKSSLQDLNKHRSSLKKIASKSDGIDRILKGGVELEAVTEVYGAYGSGKTQFAYSVMVEAVEKNGWKAIWLDCEDTFDIGRLIEVIKARGYCQDMTDEEIIEKYDDKIQYIHTYNTDVLVNEINAISKKLYEDPQIKLLILDGAIGQFRAEYLGRGVLASRQQSLARFMALLKNLAFIFNCAVVITNQVMSNPAQSFGDPTLPIGGHVVGHGSTYRIYFQKRGSKRFAVPVDSPKIAVYDEEFKLTDKGVDNP